MRGDVFSTAKQLAELEHVLVQYTRLPFYTDQIPGGIMEAAIAEIRSGRVLPTYDFVDVVHEAERCGWQVKSTKATTPVTWKRAKLPDQASLIEASKRDAAGLQALGDAIIHFCNEHAAESFARYEIDTIGYARLILRPDGSFTYFERELCTRERPRVFDPRDFSWKWSKQKDVKKKEQLSALHGVHRTSGEKWWAWHGLGENQLHFSGEKHWWPGSGAKNRIDFRPAEKRMNLSELVDLLKKHGS